MKRRGTRRQPMPERPQLPATILMLDLGSLKTGWAWAKVDANARVVQRQSGVLLLEQQGPVLWRRIDYFAKWLSLACKEWGISYLAVEAPYPGAHSVIHGLYLLCDLASGRLFGRPVHPISRIAVFKSTVGWTRRTSKQGRRTVVTTPSKTEMMAAVNARHGHTQGRRISSEDEADAVAALDTVLAELAGTGMRQAPPVAPAPARQPRAIKLPLLGAKPAAAVKARGRRPAA